MSITDHFATERRIELALNTLNQAWKDKSYILTCQELERRKDQEGS